ncbi:MAG: PEP-CTERM sorting domain-containing protein [Rhizobacter sp.]
MVVAAALAYAAAVPLSSSARQVEPELGLPVDISAGSAVEADTVKAPEATGSTTSSKSRREFVSDVAEPKSYLLLLAGLGVLGFVASRRKLG